MKLVITILFALTMLLYLSSAAVAEGNRSDVFTLSPLVGGYSFDGEQHLQTRPVYGIRGGYNFTRNFGAEALFDYVQSVGTQPGFGDIHLFRYGADFLWHFMPDSKLVPYLAGGYSAITTDYENRAFLGGDIHFHSTSGALDYGGGIKYFIDNDWALRGDFRHLVVQAGGAPFNYEYTVGLTYHFGLKQLASLFKRGPKSEEALEPEPEPEPAKPVAKRETKGASAPGAQSESKIEAPPAAETETEKEAPLEPLLAAEPAPGRFKYCSTLHIEFDVGSSTIRPEYQKDIAVLGDFMKGHPTTTAIIEGHTDNVGGFEANMKVSQQRAETVVNYLVQHFGIEHSRLVAIGYGSTRPVADNATIEGQEKNRRIEAIIDCPLDVKKVLPPEPAKLCVLLQIEFDSGKAYIKPEYHDEIAQVGDFMKKYPTTTAVIEGHTDNVGGYEYNMNLSQKRAESVVSYLVKNFGIEQSRLAAKGYGYKRRIAYNNTAEGRQKNRRINAIIDCAIKQ